jgi:hypothetical protein
MPTAATPLPTLNSTLISPRVSSLLRPTWSCLLKEDAEQPGANLDAEPPSSLVCCYSPTSGASHTSSGACSYRPMDPAIAASTAWIRPPPHILGGWRHDALLILRSRATSCRGGSRHMCPRSGDGRLDPTSALDLVLDQVSVESKVNCGIF